jgi:hypothetical protein
MSRWLKPLSLAFVYVRAEAQTYLRGRDKISGATAKSQGEDKSSGQRQSSGSEERKLGCSVQISGARGSIFKNLLIG